VNLRADGKNVFEEFKFRTPFYAVFVKRAPKLTDFAPINVKSELCKNWTLSAK
jgi:hypothetical protein